MNASSLPPDDFESMATLRGLRPGDRILGRFKLVRCEGRGGMGEVWLASDEVLGEDVALKLLPRLIQGDDQTIEDLKKETRHGRQLAHPHIARVFDFYQDQDNVCVAMEFVRGDNLARLRARQESGRFEASQISAWAAQLLDALDYAHRIGRVIHRDLKPSNLLIESATSTLKVVDFGIARSVVDSLQRVTRSVQNEGTLAYMSPEQAMGRSPNPLDDVYSAGATLYELLTGRPPFYTGDIATQIQKVPPVPPSEVLAERGIAGSIPEVWERVVVQCLAKDRAARPQGAAAVAEMLGLRQVSADLPASPVTSGGYGHTVPSAPTAPTLRSHAASTMAAPAAVSTAGVTGTATATAADVSRMPAATGGTAIHMTSGEAAPAAPAAPAVQEQPRRRGSGAMAAAIVLALAGSGAGGWIWWQNYQKANNGPKPVEPTPQQQPEVVKTPVPVTPPPTVTTPVKDTQPETDKKPEIVTTPVKPPVTPKTGELRVPGDFAKVQQAIDAAAAGQLIRVGKGTWNERLTLKSGIQLIGSSAQETIISSDGRAGSVINCRNSQDVVIEGMTISHSGAEPIAGAQAVIALDSSSMELRRCHVKDGAGDGVLAAQGSKMHLTDCEMIGNAAAGVSIQSGSVLTLRGGALNRNDRGLVVALASSNADLTNCRIEENYQQGVEISDRGSAKLKSTTLTGNKLAGVFVIETGSSIRLDDCDITGSTAGVQAENGGSITIENSRIGKNTNGFSGLNPGTVEIRKSKIRQNLLHGIALESASAGAASVVQIDGNTINNNGQAGIFVGGSALKPDVTGNDIGPNGHDLCVQDGAGGRYEKNVLRTKDEAILADDPAVLQAANQMSPGTQPNPD